MESKLSLAKEKQANLIKIRDLQASFEIEKVTFF